MSIPNPETHLQLSLAKSILRIIAGMLLVMQIFVGAGLFLILAEILGILEEVF